MLQLKKFPHIPVSTREEARESRPHPEEPRFRLIAREEGSFPSVIAKEFSGVTLHRKGERNSLSCHHSQSPPDVSVNSRKSCFPCTASTFKPRINSHHGGTWDSPVGKPRGIASWESLVGKPHGKASMESHRSLDPREGKCQTAATAMEESARECPHSRRGLPPLGRLH